VRFEREGRGWRRWGERLDGRRASKLIYGMLFGLDGNGLDGECACSAWFTKGVCLLEVV
jgi:hypothetical protein